MIKVLRVGHATFTTPDLEREVAYYSDVLGLIVTERDKNRAFLATRTGVEAISLERGVVKYAEGSCFVKFGDTHVLVTATLEDRQIKCSSCNQWHQWTKKDTFLR